MPLCVDVDLRHLQSPAILQPIYSQFTAILQPFYSQFTTDFTAKLPTFTRTLAHRCVKGCGARPPAELLRDRSLEPPEANKHVQL